MARRASRWLILAAPLLLAGGLVTLAARPWAGDPAPVAQAAAPPAPAKPAATAAPPPAKAATPADPDFSVRRVLRIAKPFRHGDYVWDEAGVPAGPVVITVDLKAQTLSVFRAGYEIGAAVILYGADDKPTPLGTYHVSEKDADHVSNLYHAPMPYMLRLTDDGISIHGSEVSWGYATHGCIGVPVAFARKLFGQAKLGTPVVVTSGRMLALPPARS